MSVNEKTLLEVDQLKTYFYTDDGVVKAVDNVSFSVQRGETLGVVGESGCGKSVTSFSIMQLVARPRGKIVSGTILYHGKDNTIVNIAALPPTGRKMRSIRGNEIAMIFQEPMTSLNPVYTIGDQIMEAIRLHQMAGKAEAKRRAIEMLDHVGIPSAKKRVDEYPYEFSGGMRQRAMIAMALSCNPNFLIADEPTTALDVTIEAQILKLMKDLQKELGMSIMFITHDLGVIAEMSNRVLVMYTGKVVEEASCHEIFRNAKHPYTKGLLKSRPRIGYKGRLPSIVGSVPSLKNLPSGCTFYPRCPHAFERCSQERPHRFKVSEDHYARCWLYENEED